jgi:hypothetical protein
MTLLIRREAAAFVQHVLRSFGVVAITSWSRMGASASPATSSRSGARASPTSLVCERA